MTNPACDPGLATLTNFIYRDSFKISTNANNAGIGNKLLLIPAGR